MWAEDMIKTNSIKLPNLIINEINKNERIINNESKINYYETNCYEINYYIKSFRRNNL